MGTNSPRLTLHAYSPMLLRQEPTQKQTDHKWGERKLSPPTSGLTCSITIAVDGAGIHFPAGNPPRSGPRHKEENTGAASKLERQTVTMG